MAVLETTVETVGTVSTAPVEAAPAGGATPAAAPTPAVRAGVRTAALVQWVVVGSLLAYGVSQTAIKAAALFG